MSVSLCVRAMNFRKHKLQLGLIGMLLLSACDDTGAFDLDQLFKPKPDAEATPAAPAEATEFTEKDVEAPEVFSATEAGLWDGRPSLGGVWVAHPDVKQPERVIIRNETNGQFVVGALFRRERDIPGPRLQISSDAAQAIGVLAGSPVQLDVTALRKERTPVAPAPVQTASEATEAIAAPEEISETSLDPIIAAGAAIDAAAPTPAEAATEAAAPVAVASTLPVSTLDKPYIQVGIFSIEQNADRVAAQMKNAGMVPTVLAQEASGKAFWRVVVGPAATSGERRKLLEQIKEVGFSDAYAVTN